MTPVLFTYYFQSTDSGGTVYDEFVALPKAANIDQSVALNAIESLNLASNKSLISSELITIAVNISLTKINSSVQSANTLINTSLLLNQLLQIGVSLDNVFLESLSLSKTQLTQLSNTALLQNQLTLTLATSFNTETVSTLLASTTLEKQTEIFISAVAVLTDSVVISQEKTLFCNSPEKIDLALVLAKSAGMTILETVTGTTVVYRITPERVWVLDRENRVWIVRG